MNALRVRHLENSLHQYESNLSQVKQPIDLFLMRYFTSTKLSPSDRSWIADNFYELHRWKGLLDYVTPPPATWSSRLRTYFISDRWKAHTMNERLSGHIRGSCPEVLFKRLESTYGPKKALQICYVLNEPAPTFLRINALRTRRDQALKFLLSKGMMIEKSINSPLSLQLQNKQRLLDLPEYNQGLFEIQDESSQLICQKIPIRPGDKVLDFCAGSGGKSVVMGPMLAGQGRLYLHDVKDHLLSKARKRLKNAAVANYAIVTPKDPALSNLKGQMDYVLVDVPCTAIGTARRNPDLKWNFSNQRLFEMVGLQREIFEQALQYMKPNSGRIVYSTASILDEENVQQIKYFCYKHGLLLVEPPTHSLPVSKGMDGFFMAILTKANTSAGNIQVVDGLTIQNGESNIGNSKKIKLKRNLQELKSTRHDEDGHFDETKGDYNNDQVIIESTASSPSEDFNSYSRNDRHVEDDSFNDVSLFVEKEQSHHQFDDDASSSNFEWRNQTKSKEDQKGDILFDLKVKGRSGRSSRRVIKMDGRRMTDDVADRVL